MIYSETIDFCYIISNSEYRGRFDSYLLKYLKEARVPKSMYKISEHSYFLIYSYFTKLRKIPSIFYCFGENSLKKKYYVLVNISRNDLNKIYQLIYFPNYHSNNIHQAKLNQKQENRKVLSFFLSSYQIINNSFLYSSTYQNFKNYRKLRIIIHPLERFFQRT